MKKIRFTACTLAASILIFFIAAEVLSQTVPPKVTTPPAASSGDRNRQSEDDTPLTTFEEELRAKRLIKMAEKDHQENVGRAREIQQLAKELKETLQGKSALDREGLKKIDRIEKLTKKVRGEAGGEDQDLSIPNPPSDLCSAATQIAEKAESLSKDVQNTPRQVVSASVIASANVLLELIKVARTFARPQQ